MSSLLLIPVLLLSVTEKIVEEKKESTEHARKQPEETVSLLSDRDHMHGQYSKEIQHTFLNSLWNEDMLNENHVVAKIYPSYKIMTLVQGLSSREHCKSIYNYNCNSDEINNYIWGQNRELSRYLFYILFFLLLSLFWMMCCFKRWILNLWGF